MDCVIGVDLGATQLRAVLADRSGQIHATVRMLTEASQGPAAVIERIVACIAQAGAALPVGAQLCGVGVGSPGPLDPEAGVVLAAPNMPGWDCVPLRAILAKRTGLTVELGNDANAAALGEWLFGGGVGRRHMVYLTISTGIGSGVIVDGRLLLGRQGAGGEAGHMIIDVAGCKSWEELASGTGLAAAAAAAMTATPQTLLHDLATPQTVTAAHVAQAANRGDALAETLMQREAELLGIGFANILHLFSPEIILVGGSVVTANPSLLAGARQVVQQRVIADVYRSVPIEVAALGEQVGLLGAAALVFYQDLARA